METNVSSNPASRRRLFRKAKEIAVIVIVLAFYGIYRIPSAQIILDKAITPAVAGISLGYGKVSTFVYRVSGLNFGFVSLPVDSDFLFNVQLATYINQKQAAPILNLASDQRLPIEKRELALRALTKFESANQWIQAFLNELPKGGLLGLYDSEAPLLDELIKEIRAEGGVRQDLVRAYAEVVFGFMLQVPDAVVRQHALNWVSDVLAEDAIFLIVPRLSLETDPKVRESIDMALMNIRAVSDPQRAISLLNPHYQKPSWPSARIPLATVLARLGHESAVDYLEYVIKSQPLSKEELVTLRVATSRTPYPAVVKISEKEKLNLVRNEKRRETQRRESWEKYQETAREERVKQILLAKKVQKEKESNSELIEKFDSAQELNESNVQPENQSTLNSVTLSASHSDEGMSQKEVQGKITNPSTTTKEPSERKITPVVPVVNEDLDVGKSTIESEEKLTSPHLTEKAVISSVPKSFIVSEPEASKSGKSVEADGAVIPLDSKEKLNTSSLEQHASLPPDLNMPEDTTPLYEEMSKPPKSLMNYVDIVFEVKEKKAVLYQNPGSNESTGVILTEGIKGKADLEVLIGEETWYQVKTKQGTGWTKGAALSVFNLSPASAVPQEPQKESLMTEKSLDADRDESTYFEANEANIPIYSKPGSRSKQTGALAEDVAYKAVKSEKSGDERWFLLQIRSGETAWVRGQDLKLANVRPPATKNIPSKPVELENQKSAFSAEWIVAGVKGVGVYSRPSIAGELILQINPPQKFRVLELSLGGGKEWYKIELAGNKNGWVQALDVSLTKPN